MHYIYKEKSVHMHYCEFLHCNFDFDNKKEMSKAKLTYFFDPGETTYLFPSLLYTGRICIIKRKIIEVDKPSIY